MTLRHPADDLQPIADKEAQHLEIISKTFLTNQNSVHGIYDQYRLINDESHENPGTPGTRLKVFRNNVKMLCHPICNWLYIQRKRERDDSQRERERETTPQQLSASSTLRLIYIEREREDSQRERERETTHIYIKRERDSSSTALRTICSTTHIYGKRERDDSYIYKEGERRLLSSFPHYQLFTQQIDDLSVQKERERQLIERERERDDSSAALRIINSTTHIYGKRERRLIYIERQRETTHIYIKRERDDSSAALRTVNCTTHREREREKRLICI